MKDIRILLRYQHDDKAAGSRSFSLCRSSANQLKEALWSCVTRILEDLMVDEITFYSASYDHHGLVSQLL